VYLVMEVCVIVLLCNRLCVVRGEFIFCQLTKLTFSCHTINVITILRQSVHCDIDESLLCKNLHLLQLFQRFPFERLEVTEGKQLHPLLGMAVYPHMPILHMARVLDELASTWTTQCAGLASALAGLACVLANVLARPVRWLASALDRPVHFGF